MVVGGDFRVAFKYLFIPASIAILLVVIAMHVNPRIYSIYPINKGSLKLRSYSRSFYLYIASVMLLSIGFIHGARYIILS